MPAPTPLSDEERIQLIADGLGPRIQGDPYLEDAYDKLDRNIPLWWREYYDKQVYGSPRLRELYVEWRALKLLIGAVWSAVDYSDADVKESLSQYGKNLQAMMDAAAVGITTIERNRLNSSGVSAGVIEKQTPLSGYPGGHDPSSRALRGDPVQRYPFPLRRPPLD